MNESTQSNEDKWNELAAGTPFEGLGNVLKSIPAPDSPTQSGKIEIGESNLDYADRVAREQSDKTELDAVIEDALSQAYEYGNGDTSKNPPIIGMRRVKAALTAREERLVAEVIGEDLRPIFSGHTDRCITCGEIGGICEDPDCTGLGGLNDHELGEHKSILCVCEKINLKLTEQRKRYLQLTSHGKDVSTQ